MKEKLQILLKLTNHFGHHLDEHEVKIRLLSDPDPGIAPISNTLDFFNIPNITATVPKTAFDQLPMHFLAQVRQEAKHDLVLVDKSRTGRVEVLSEKSEIVTKEEFLARWTGLVVAIEENQRPGKQVWARFGSLQVGLLLCAALVITYVACRSNSLTNTLYVFSAIFGLGLSHFILKEKLGMDETPSRFCTFSKDTDCRSVLNSKEANFFPHVDLSDAVVMYFSFLLLSSLVVPHSIFYFVIAAFSLPVVLYSLYLQSFKIKKWCPLCLGVATLLLVQFGLLYFSIDRLSFATLDILVFLLAAGLVVLAWYALKPLLLLQKENRSLALDNMTFRRNHRLFLPYFHTSPRRKTKVDSIADVQLGASDAPLTFLMITNPMCKTCFEMHDKLMQLLGKFEGKVQLRFRFFVPNDKENDPRTIIAKRLLDLYLYENDRFQEAFDHWYSKVSAEEWIRKWGLCKTESIRTTLAEHRQWCDDNAISYTPAIFINDKLFPKFYPPADIVHFVDAIMALEEQNSARANRPQSQVPSKS